MGVVLMVDRAKLDSYEKEFIAKFNSLLEAERNEPGTMMPLWKLTVIHSVLLPAAGYVEAMIRANIDSICEVNGHPVSSKFTIDEVYAAYTSGYNKGASVANVHRPEIVSNAAKVIPEEGS